jgi:diguanylate cyclase (GGDEF)-like protein
VLELARAALHGELSAFDLVATAVRADGSELPLHVYVSLVRDDAAEPLHFVVQIVDLSEQRRYEDELAELTQHDGLTGLLNRRAFHERLLEEVESAHRYGTALCLALVDVDNFRLLNDAHGRGAGDAVLAGVSRCLRESARTTDPLGRLGGEELAWVIPEAALAPSLDACERVRTAIARTCWTGDVRATVSIGLAELGGDEADVDLFRRADEALYAAKSRGRDRVRA